MLQQERIAGGDGLGLCCGQRGGVDLLDLSDVDLAAQELRERCGFPLDGLPHVGVEGPLGDVADDRHFLVLVALPHDATVALGDVGGPPRAVQVVQGDGAGLDVGANAHLLRRADQYRDVAGAGCGEQAGLLDVGLRLVHVPDLLGGDAALHELLPQLVVGVPPVLVRGADVAEHELERPAHRGGLPGQRIEVFVVAGALPDAVDRVGGNVDLARPGGVAGDDHADVERGLASVGGDQEHVVLVGPHLAGGDLPGTFGEGCDVVLQLDGRLHRDGGGCAAAVVALLERGHGQVEVVGGLHVGEHRPHPQQLLPVLEAGESGLHAERAAGRRDLHLRDQLAECCRPRIECADRPLRAGGVGGERISQ